MNKFKVKHAEVITGKKNDLLHIQFTSSSWIPCESVYKFKDGKRHKRSFNARLSANGTDYLMYNIKTKRNDKFSKCKCWHRSDWQLMIEDTII